MDTTTLLIIVLLVLLFAGGGLVRPWALVLNLADFKLAGRWSILLYCDELIN